MHRGGPARANARRPAADDRFRRARSQRHDGAGPKPEEVEVWIGQFRAPVKQMTVVTPEADEREGRIIVLLLDDMTLRLDSVPKAHEAARRFVDRMGANDRMAVLTMTGSSVATTADKVKLLRAIDAYSVRA